MESGMRIKKTAFLYQFNKISFAIAPDGRVSRGCNRLLPG